MNELITTLFSEFKRLNRPREVEVLLSFISGADFLGLAPYQKAENSKDKLSIVGFASHEWLKRRSSGSLKIEDTMRLEDLAVLAVETSKDSSSSLKLVPPSKLRIVHDASENQFALNGDLLKKLLQNMDLQSETNDQDDV